MTQVAEIIAREIARVGPISFARFMELALYCPVYGYYEKEGDNIGRGGDYYTNVSTGPLFGQLLACQFCEWLSKSPPEPSEFGTEQECHRTQERCHEQGQPAHRSIQKVKPPFYRAHLVEAGAHRGELARDILDWIEGHRPQLFERLQYCIVEPSERRRESQGRVLRNFEDKVRWVARLQDLECLSDDSLPGREGPAVHGIIFSNELLDSMPVHRFGWDAARRCWFEWGVTVQGDRFEWTRISNPPPCLSAQLEQVFGPESCLPDLPQDFTIDFCPPALDWWRIAANALVWGKVVTIDYGVLAQERLRPERLQGTLRAYQRHRLSADPLANPGEQDLTAHVDFSALQQVGEAAGLTTEALTARRLGVGSQLPSQLEEKGNSSPPEQERGALQEVGVVLTQEQFLTSIARRIWEGELEFQPWMVRHTRQFKTLTHPEHLGRAFRVLIQSRR